MDELPKSDLHFVINNYTNKPYYAEGNMGIYEIIIFILKIYSFISFVWLCMWIYSLSESEDWLKTLDKNKKIFSVGAWLMIFLLIDFGFQTFLNFVPEDWELDIFGEGPLRIRALLALPLSIIITIPIFKLTKFAKKKRTDEALNKISSDAEYYLNKKFIPLPEDTFIAHTKEQKLDIAAGTIEDCAAKMLNNLDDWRTSQTKSSSFIGATQIQILKIIGACRAIAEQKEIPWQDD